LLHSTAQAVGGISNHAAMSAQPASSSARRLRQPRRATASLHVFNEFCVAPACAARPDESFI
jgi:hypothetical protein